MLIKRNPSVTSRKIGSSWVVLETNHKFVRKLNKTAGLIWSNIKTSQSLEYLTDLISKKFKAAKRSDIASDIKEFVDDYIKEGLIIKTNNKSKK